EQEKEIEVVAEANPCGKAVRPGDGALRRRRRRSDVRQSEERCLNPRGGQRNEYGNRNRRNYGGANPDSKSAVIRIVNRAMRSIEGNHGASFSRHLNYRGSGCPHRQPAASGKRGETIPTFQFQ